MRRKIEGLEHTNMQCRRQQVHTLAYRAAKEHFILYLTLLIASKALCGTPEKSSLGTAPDCTGHWGSAPSFLRPPFPTN
jgi:hypothetical protein